MELKQILEAIYPLSDAVVKQLLEISAIVNFPRNHILLKQGRVEQHLYFIRKGLARAYADEKDDAISFWFGTEGDTIVSMASYVYQQPGYENVQLLEAGEMYEIKATDLQKLYQTNLEIASWGRRFAETELLKAEQRFINRLCRSAPERYKALLEQAPDLLQRVPLKHIASYLGITQVSLSRIRSEMR